MMLLVRTRNKGKYERFECSRLAGHQARRLQEQEHSNALKLEPAVEKDRLPIRFRSDYRKCGFAHALARQDSRFRCECALVNDGRRACHSRRSGNFRIYAALELGASLANEKRDRAVG